MKDRDEINDFLRNEIRLGDMRAKVTEELTTPTESGAAVKKPVIDVVLQREQTIQELERLLEEAVHQRDDSRTELE